jgi:FAD/FMN-containing dehydrogenase
MRDIVAFFIIGVGLVALAGQAGAQTCPAFSLLTFTCENGVCDVLAGENEWNCPGDCLDQATHVKPYYSLAVSCPETTIFQPASVAEAQEAMRLSVARGQRVRVVGTVHTGTKAVCSEEGNVISTRHLTGISGVERYGGQEVVNVQAGAHI